MRNRSSFQSPTVSPWAFIVAYAACVLLASFGLSAAVQFQNQREDAAALQRLETFTYQGHGQ